ncbi:hypothetical protein B0T17DRAFT_606418 [Bombardia bombarda]|uniref:3-keto-steroid reductase n=1 Tax=Bombardia bombarda TaxID=252184 RepID=A0AA40C8Y2_9PEZI|nr:hypothetical protein B0T17DRAFT_606418 [Bombardia bombarda]
MAPAPWESVPARDTLFVLVTGANSGIGFGIGQRLIDEYLTTRSLSAHLVLIVTTRSTKKSQETVNGLRQHAKAFAATSTALQSRVGPDYDPDRHATNRIHVLSVELDLCNLSTIRRAADLLVDGTLSSPCRGDDAAHFEPLINVKIPRLDSVIFNAGVGGWTGIAWSLVAQNILTKGLVQAVTWPTFKAATAGHVVNPLPDAPTKDTPKVGEVFCANVLGHYIFAHLLQRLLSRPQQSTTADNEPPLPPGRIIWESSIEPCWDNLSLDDFQGIRTNAAYESTKRLTDVLALSASLPAPKPSVTSYLTTTSAKGVIPPKIYLVHPGVVQTTLFPLNAFMFFWYRIVLYVARWLGSPWHPITAYNGACAPVWLVLQEQTALDAARAERVKWGSGTDRRGECRVLKTEVEGWGWDGEVVPEGYKSKRKASGRKKGAVELTRERREEFEAVGAECWRKMEELRGEWEGRIV